MRVGIIAAAGADPTPDPRIGERDALLVRSRLTLDDVDFEVTVVDPSQDLAEQLDELIRSLPEEIDDLVFYASCLLAVVDDGDCYLCLDPDNPDVGDDLRDVVATIAGVSRRGLLVALDLRFDDPDADRNTLTNILTHVQDCVDANNTGIELIAAVRPVDAHPEKIPSRLTAGLLGAMDDEDGALTARQAYATAIQKTDFGEWPNVLSYSAGEMPLFLIPSDGEPPSEEPVTEEPPTARPEDVDLDVEPPTARREELPERSEPVDEPPPAPREELPERSEPVDEPPPVTPEPATRQEPAPERAAAAQVAEEDIPVEQEEDLTPTTPRVPDDARAEQISVTVQAAAAVTAPASERRIAATTTLPTHAKPSAPESLPKVMLGARAKSSHPPASEPPPPSEPEPGSRPQKRPLLETVADGPEAKRFAGAREAIDDHEQAPMTKPQGSATDGEEIVADEPSSEDLEDISIEEEIAAPPPAPSKKRPMEMTVEDHVSAGDLARKAGRDDEALSQYKRALAKLGTQAVPLRAEVYVRIGEISRRQGKTRVAISNFDKALNISPDDQRALGALIDLNAEAGNWRSVAAAEDKFFAALDESDEDHFNHLLSSGDLWREGAQDLKRAKARYEAARKLAPKRIEPLERLLLIQEVEGTLEQVLDLRRRIAMLTEDEAERARVYFALGQYCFEKDREEDAYAALELALDSDPTFLQALEVLSNALADDQEWGELERVYEKMITSFEQRDLDEETTTVLSELHHRLALLHRDHLEDPVRALESLDRELDLRPDQLSTRVMAADLAVEVDDKDVALHHLRIAAQLEPKRAETYHQAFLIAQRHDDLESAFLAASVTSMLGASNDKERFIHQSHRVEGVPALHQPLDHAAWVTLKGEDREASVDAVMRAIAPAVLRTRIRQLEKEKKLPSYPDESRQDLDTSTISAVRSLGWACQFLGVHPPIVYIDDKSPAPLSAPFAKQQTTVVGSGALRGRTLSELAFIAGQHVALRLPEHELVAHLRSADELTACFLAALQIVFGKSPVSGGEKKAVEALAAAYGKQQTPEERDALIAAVDAFGASGGRVNLRAWIASVERCASRAGLLLCGNLETAARLIEDEGDGRLVTSGELIDDLSAFTISGEHVALRATLGVTI